MQEKMSGASCIIKSLEDLGVKEIFGYTGGAILPVFQALEESSIKLTVNSNEQSCAFSAAGMSRANGHVGIALVTSGPAITNTLTAVADAYGDSIPLIIIAGQVPIGKMGTDAFQHIDVASIFSSCTKKVFSITTKDSIEEIIKEAYYLAKSGKPGPVVIDVPKDIQIKLQEYKAIDCSLVEKKYVSSTTLSDTECEIFFSLLKQAKKPLLYIGGGLVSDEGSAALRAFNQHFNIPYVNTLMGKGVLPEDAHLGLGMLGMFGTPEANTSIQENDFFFALGVRWDDRVAEKVGSFALQAKIAYIDINPEKVDDIKKERNISFSFVGDAASALETLLEYAKKHNITMAITQWHERIKEIKKSYYLEKTNDIITQQEVIIALNKKIQERKIIITTGVGNHQMLAAQHIKMQSPKKFLTSGSFGTMGFSLPTAIGAQKTRPDHTIIAIDGDGSIKMNFGELHTIGANNIPIKVLLLNNRVDGMVRNIQQVKYDNSFIGTNRKGTVDFSRVAKECSFTFTKRIERREELDEKLTAWLDEKGPAFLEVLTDKDEAVYPIIRAGKAYNEMELGHYKQKSRSDLLEFKEF